METNEDALSRAEEIVRETEKRVADRAKLVEELEKAGQRDAAKHAGRVLEILQRSLEAARADLCMERAVHHAQFV